MPTVDAYLNDLARWIGTTESPAGSNCQPFSHALGRPCEKWCADFLAARARAVGLKLPSESASTRTMAAAFQKAGRWHQTPARGDIGFCDFADGSSGIQHVVAVERVGPDGTVWTIEGNTSSGVAGSQSNGGGVWRRHRARSVFVGFGRPEYSSAPASPAPAPPRPTVVVGPAVEIDVQLVPIDVTITTDNEGRGNEWVAVDDDKIVSARPKGIRPNDDRRYLTADVGAAEETHPDAVVGSVISVEEWAPNSVVTIRLWTLP
jgi:hypothetical protein